MIYKLLSSNSQKQKRNYRKKYSKQWFPLSSTFPKEIQNYDNLNLDLWIYPNC